MGHAAESGAEQCEKAFARYVLPEVEVLLRVAGSITRRPADAEDLVQDTLLRAYQGIGGFDGTHPRAWLLTIMRNAHVNRNRRRRPDLLDDHDAADRLAAARSGGETPEQIVVGATIDAVVTQALSALPQPFREVVMLVDVDRLSYAEAAAALAIPEGTVMSRLHRARSRMRRRLVAAGLAPRRNFEDKARRLIGTRDVASRIHVMRVLQSYLDGRTDEATARRVSNHLEACWRCGLEAETYREIKAALARQDAQPEAAAVARLQDFGARLAAGRPDEGEDETTPPA